MNLQRWILVIKGIAILLFLYLFIVGIQSMGHAFKLFGKEFAQQMLTSTQSPFLGLFVGILATAIIQSSSTTTSIVVGMVAGGAISIEGAIPMIMGANIGTTITNVLVSVGHVARTSEFRRAFAAALVHDFFNLIAVAVLFPLELATGIIARTADFLAGLFEGAGGLKVGDFMKVLTKPAVEAISTLCRDQPVAVLLVGVVLIFLMLFALVKTLRSMVLERIEAFFDAVLFKNPLRAMVFGMLVTVAVQSSSITTSLVVPLAGAGILKIAQVFPFTLGANVGTTVTAMLAAMATGSHDAVTVAFGHFMFNVFGILMIWPHPRIRRIPIVLSEALADLSLRNRALPLTFIPIVFFGVPLLFILLFR